MRKTIIIISILYLFTTPAWGQNTTKMLITEKIKLTLLTYPLSPIFKGQVSVWYVEGNLITDPIGIFEADKDDPQSMWYLPSKVGDHIIYASFVVNKKLYGPTDVYIIVKVYPTPVSIVAGTPIAR